MTNERLIDTDIMRIICCFCVTVIHMVTSNRVGILDSTANIINSLCRFSVPVFIIISGRYMLGKKYSIGMVIKKCLNLFLEMVIVSIIYLLFDIILYDKNINSFRELIGMILTTPIHLWYIYAIMILYLFTPMLYILCQNATKNELVYAIIICFMLGNAYIPLRTTDLTILKDIIDKCHLEGNLTFIACYLLGNYLERYMLSKKEKITIYLFGILGLSVSVYANNSIFVNNEAKTIMLSFFAPNVISQSIMFYIFIKEIAKQVSKYFSVLHNNKAVKILAQSTHSVYLWHVLVQDLLILYLFDNISTTSGCFAICIMTFFICASIFIVYNCVLRLLKGWKL